MWARGNDLAFVIGAMNTLDLAGSPEPIAEPWRPRTQVRGPRYLVDPETETRLVVEERPAHGVAGARHTSCLIFFFDLGFHRIWKFPVNWDQLPDDELLRLGWHARRAA